MPIESKAQRRFLWAKEPELARKWEAETPKVNKLPEHVKKKKRKGKRDGER